MHFRNGPFFKLSLPISTHTDAVSVVVVSCLSSLCTAKFVCAKDCLDSQKLDLEKRVSSVKSFKLLLL